MQIKKLQQNIWQTVSCFKGSFDFIGIIAGFLLVMHNIRTTSLYFYLVGIKY